MANWLAMDTQLSSQMKKPEAKKKNIWNNQVYIANKHRINTKRSSSDQFKQKRRGVGEKTFISNEINKRL